MAKEPKKRNEGDSSKLVSLSSDIAASRMA